MKDQQKKTMYCDILFGLIWKRKKNKKFAMLFPKRIMYFEIIVLIEEWIIEKMNPTEYSKSKRKAWLDTYWYILICGYVFLEDNKLSWITLQRFAKAISEKFR